MPFRAYVRSWGSAASGSRSCRLPDFRELWDFALPYGRFVAESEHHRGLWEGIYKLMRVPEWAFQAVPPGTRRRLLVIAEDWCGDASSTIPIVARFADAVPGMELRLLRRDEHPELMDRYLTNGARSIPIVIVLDESFRELGHWGPRPAELQAWVPGEPPSGTEGRALSPGPAVVRAGSR